MLKILLCFDIWLYCMNSKISFYSFKDTENNETTRRFRKDKQSYFE
jgi:hypothetical protein